MAGIDEYSPVVAEVGNEITDVSVLVVEDQAGVMSKPWRRAEDDLDAEDRVSA